MKFGESQSGHRIEDARFLKGAGRFLANRDAAGTLSMAVLRSPHGHADITSLDTSRAETMPGIVGIITASDLERAGIGRIKAGTVESCVEGRVAHVPPFDLLAADRVRYAGQAVAAVIAETRAAALDAVEAIDIAYVERPAVVDLAAAVSGTTDAIWPEAPDNVAVHWRTGDPQAVAAAFAAADRVVELELVNNRVSANPIETRSAVGTFDPASGIYTLHTNGQGPQILREVFADQVLRTPRSRVRVVTDDVGGGFGMKAFPYVEQGLVLIAARRFGRPVAWHAERSEALLGDYHARDHRTRISLALDADGRFLALKADTLANLGAMLSIYGLYIPTSFYADGLVGAYRLPALQVDVRTVFTNTSPVDAYRGAGRAEGSYALERIVDAAARAIGVDPLELRLRNMIGADELPYRNALGSTYDTGGFTACVEAAAERANISGLAARRASAGTRGRLRGAGIGCSLTPVGYNAGDVAQISIDSGGDVLIGLGNVSCGQGHETVAVRLVSEALGVEPHRLRVVQGDSDRISEFANSNGGSNFLQSAAPALQGAAERIVAKGRHIAAHLLEAAIDDIEFRDGGFTVAGTDRNVGVAEVAAAAHNPAALPEDIQPGWTEGHFHRATDTYPFGCHIAEVEVCAETGEVEIVGYTAVSDFGEILDPDLVVGQVHGGITQGLGQALTEHFVYDGDGQPLSGSFMDYAMPRASSSPMPDVSFIATPAASNRLGVKGCGEVPTSSASPAVINAILDALASLGVTAIDMPATPARVWQAIEAAR